MKDGERGRTRPSFHKVDQFAAYQGFATERLGGQGLSMNNVSGHLAILAGAGVAAALLALATYVGRRMETSASAQAPVVVTVPARASAAPPPQAAPRQPPPGTASPRDPASLARQLQSELRRVGCYDGELSGVWTPRTRMAMKAFTDRVNASLPVDKPDQILLALVQNHQGVACVPPPVLAKAPAKPEPPETDAAPKSVPVPAIVPPIAAIAPKISGAAAEHDTRGSPATDGPRRSHSGAAAGAAATCLHGRARRASTAQPAPRRPGAGSRRLRAPSAPHRPPLSAGPICACAAAEPEAGRVDAVAPPMIGRRAPSAHEIFVILARLFAPPSYIRPTPLPAAHKRRFRCRRTRTCRSS